VLNPQSLQFRQIQPSDNTTKLSLGKKEYQPLKSFLRNCALDFHQNHIASTYVLVDEVARVWGYITLMCSEVTLGSGYSFGECPRANEYKIFPAVKVARLAVDKRLQGQGYGRLMIDWCVSMVKNDIMPIIGCRFLTVDAKRVSVPFYEKMGFNMLETPANIISEHPVMFIDLYKVK